MKINKYTFPPAKVFSTNLFSEKENGKTMGTAEPGRKELIISSHIITYGNAADEEITERIRKEIETMWNEPMATFKLKDLTLRVVFKITASFIPHISDIDIYRNTDPRNNYFRIEEFSFNHISFTDGIGCNSGYFKKDNLYEGSTTAAHEYGHTLGLEHPKNLDIRGKGVPGIMYPRGTLVDPEFQYDASVTAGKKGGTLHPIYRKVLQQDINNLKLHKLSFKNNFAVIGNFTNIFHEKHAS